mgnify:CR=1 FL=1
MGLLLTAGVTNFAKAETIDNLPVLGGSNVPTNNSSCYKCIRGGWLWCSAKWNYEEPTANASTYSAAEKGKCCFEIKTLAVEIVKAESANVTKCPARFSNTSAEAVAEIP